MDESCEPDMPRRTKGDEDVFRNPPPAELGKHRGEWIAVLKGKIVAHGHDGATVYATARRLHPGKRVMVMRIPSERHALY